MSARDRNLLTAVVVLAVLGAFWLLALGPRREQAGTLAAQVAATQLERDQLAQQAATAQSTQQRYDDDFAVVARLGKAVPQTDDSAALLYQLQDAAGDAKVELEALTATGAAALPAGAAASTPTPVAAPATTQQFDLTFTGTYPALQRFLARVQSFTRVRGDRVEVSGRLLTVDGFSLKVDPVGGRVVADVKATTYLAAPAAPAVPATPAASPAPAPAPTTAAAPPVPAAVVAGG